MTFHGVFVESALKLKQTTGRVKLDANVKLLIRSPVLAFQSPLCLGFDAGRIHQPGLATLDPALQGQNHPAKPRRA